MTKPYTLGILQMQYTGSPSTMLEKSCQTLMQAADKGVEVACLPELFLTNYFCQKLDPDVFNLAEPMDGETNQRLSEIAKKTGMVIVSSIFEKAAEGLFYNTIVVIEKDGRLAGSYRKMHIPHDPLFEEKYYFAPGDQGFKAHHTSAGKLGTLVCWDQWYPEAARLTSMQGADILLYPTAIGWHPSEKAQWGESQLDSWVTIQRAHAIANGVYVAAINRIGHEGPRDGGIEFWGNSFICDPYGRIITRAGHDKEEILTATIDPALIDQKRRHWPFFRDRRVDAYGDLTKRFG